MRNQPASLRAAVTTLVAILSSVALAAAATPMVLLPSVPGEVMPTLTKPSLIENADFDSGQAGWETRVDKGVVVTVDVASAAGPGFKPQPALRVQKKSGLGTARVISAVFPVQPDTDYLLTGLYQTTNAKFGALAEWRLLESESEGGPASLDVNITSPSYGGHTGHISVFNSRPNEWRRRTRTFHTGPKTHFARLAILVEGPPVTLLFDNLYLNTPEPDTRAWNWPKPEAGVSRAEAERIVANRPDSRAQVKRENGEARLYVDGKLRAPFVHLSDVPKPQRGYMGDFAGAGVNLHMIALLNDSLKHWTGPGKYDFKKIDETIWESVRRDPTGNYIIYINVMPYPGWEKDFPDHAAVNAEGKPAVSRHDRTAPPSYYSTVYRQQVMDLLRTYVRHIKAQPYSRAVVGFMLGGGEDGQFYYQVVRGQQTLQDGHSPGDLPLFRQWLKDRYVTEDKLRQAWNQPEVTFETARPKISNTRYPGIFLNPQTQAMESDVLLFLNEEVAQLLVDGLTVCKQEIGKPVLGAAYYGRGMAQMVYPQFAENSVIYKSDAVDLLGAQGGYYGWREAGSESLLPWVFDSARKHGKIPMMELDHRTALSQYRSLSHDFQVTRFWNDADLDGAMARDAGKMISTGGGAWWMEMTGGWFHDPATMKFIGKMREASDKVLAATKGWRQNDVALVVDEGNIFRTTEQFNLWNGPQFHSLNIQQRAIMRSGVGYDLLYLDDLLKGQRDDYKVYVFLNPYYVSPEARRFIDQKLKRNGKLLVWQYAPGYVTDQGFSTAAMQQLTGLKIATGPTENPAGLTSIFAAGNGVTKGLAGQKMGLGPDLPAQRFWIEDAQAETVGTYTSDGRVSAALKRFPNYTSLFLGHPSALTPQFLQNIAKLGGVQPYVEPGEATMFHRDNFIVVHGIEGGYKTFRLPYRANVTEMLSGRVLAKASDTVSLDVTVGDTYWLYLERA